MIEFLRILRYITIGGISATIETFTFLYFRNFISTIKANIIAWFIATSFGFLGQKNFTFKNKGPYFPQSFKFFSCVGIGFLMNNFLVWLFIERWHWTPFWGKMTQLFLVFIWNYNSQKFLVFK